MPKHKPQLNQTVDIFLISLNHPYHKEINMLRKIILNAEATLEENIKWNAPNYVYQKNDRITMRILPPKQVQLIFHRGAKTQTASKTKLIDVTFPWLDWKDNDRAVANFKDGKILPTIEKDLQQFIQAWLKITSTP